MIPYKTKADKLPGSNLSEAYTAAWKVFHAIEKKTRRKAYIRSAYFKKEKIFFDHFWIHLKQKGPKERFKRLKYFRAAIEVITESKNEPTIKRNPNKKTEVFYRFAGMNKSKEVFIVQVKENTMSKRKYFMSCFPIE